MVFEDALPFLTPLIPNGKLPREAAVGTPGEKPGVMVLVGCP